MGVIGIYRCYVVVIRIDFGFDFPQLLSNSKEAELGGGVQSAIDTGKGAFMPIQDRTATASESPVGLDGCVPKCASCVSAFCSSQEQSVCIISPAPCLALPCHPKSRAASVTALTRPNAATISFLRKGLKPRQAPNDCRPRSGRSRRPRYSPSLSLQPSSVSLACTLGKLELNPGDPSGETCFWTSRIFNRRPSRRTPVHRLLYPARRAL